MSTRHVSRRQRRRVELQLELIEKCATTSRFSMLDVGTEWGLSAISVKSRWPHAEIIGCDAHLPAAAEALSGGAYRAVYCEDALSFLRYSVYGSEFGVVLAAEVVEHCEKSAGRELLRLTEERAIHMAIVTSPIGFLAQGELDGNPWQVHRSGWTPEELEALGWTTYATDHELNLFVSYKAKP